RIVATRCNGCRVVVRTRRRPLSRQRLGINAEQAAFRYLLEKGLQPVARNFRTRRGEIDLVMLDDCCLVFVEVRYRTGNSFVEAQHTVDKHKQRKLTSAASMFLARHELFQQHVCRFDVVGVDHRGGEVSVTWLRDAFRPSS
ncbi:MAG: YraN family protein, partial [Woeseiaceae bacterium]